MSGEPPQKVVLIWSSRDKEVALNLVFMYAKNARLQEWWQEVTLVIWGPSAQVITEDQDLQKELKALQEAGVEVLACKACADRYGTSAALKEMGVRVIYMGQPLTAYLKSGTPVLTF